MPNKSKFRKYGIQFEEGEQYSIEYIRNFGSFFLGSTLSTKLYENKKITGIKVDDRIKGDSSDYIHLVDTGQIKLLVKTAHLHYPLARVGNLI